MLDPRLDIANMLYELREKLNELECKLWEIPHHQEPVEEYEAVFTAPKSGDYMHPDTPTHEKPEGFSDAAYWDSCCQCWMEPTQWDWDEYNYCDNANADISYNCESNSWVEGEDWSNHYADDWYDYDSAATVFVEDHHEEMHVEDHAGVEVVEPAPAPVEPAPVHTNMGDDEHVEPAPVEEHVEEAPIDPNQPEG
jgi:hypothetical protein